MTKRELQEQLSACRKALDKANRILIASGASPVRVVLNERKPIPDLPGQKVLFNNGTKKAIDDCA